MLKVSIVMIGRGMMGQKGLVRYDFTEWDARARRHNISEIFFIIIFFFNISDIRETYSKGV